MYIYYIVLRILYTRVKKKHFTMSQTQRSQSVNFSRIVFNVYDMNVT
jgi:hypothetical protein